MGAEYPGGPTTHGSRRAEMWCSMVPRLHVPLRSYLCLSENSISGSHLDSETALMEISHTSSGVISRLRGYTTKDNHGIS